MNWAVTVNYSSSAGSLFRRFFKHTDHSSTAKINPGVSAQRTEISRQQKGRKVASLQKKGLQIFAAKLTSPLRRNQNMSSEISIQSSNWVRKEFAAMSIASLQREIFSFLCWIGIPSTGCLWFTNYFVMPVSDTLDAQCFIFLPGFIISYTGRVLRFLPLTRL